MLHDAKLQHLAGSVAYNVLGAGSPKELTDRLMYGVDHIERVVGDDPRMAPQLQGLRDLAATGDPHAIANKMMSVVSNSSDFLQRVAQRGAPQQPARPTPAGMQVVSSDLPAYVASVAQPFKDMWGRTVQNVGESVGTMAQGIEDTRAGNPLVGIPKALGGFESYMTSPFRAVAPPKETWDRAVKGATESLDEMGKGFGEMIHGSPQVGIPRMALGATGLVSTPLTAVTQPYAEPALRPLGGAVHNYIGKPIEDLTGYPAEIIDAAVFATAIPLGRTVKGVLRPRVPVGKLSENFNPSSHSIGYNPPVKPQRPLEADYPHGVETESAGRLLRTIEGRPIEARYVVGRSTVGGGDVAFPQAAFDTLATQTTGRLPTVVPKSALRRQIGGQVTHDLGQATFVERNGQLEPTGIKLSRELTEDERRRVYAHELGHVIDEIAGQIKTDGLLREELHPLYDDLNNPYSSRRKAGSFLQPKHFGYGREAAPRELMAEAVRAYLTDPNYIKTVAPRTAARIREKVNAHPTLSKIIQFNAFVPAATIGGGLLVAGHAAGPNTEE